MTTLGIVLSFIIVALLFVSSGIGIAFFGSWAWYVLSDLTHGHHGAL